MADSSIAPPTTRAYIYRVFIFPPRAQEPAKAQAQAQSNGKVQRSPSTTATTSTATTTTTTASAAAVFGSGSEALAGDRTDAGVVSSATVAAHGTGVGSISSSSVGAAGAHREVEWEGVSGKKGSGVGAGKKSGSVPLLKKPKR